MTIMAEDWKHGPHRILIPTITIALVFVVLAFLWQKLNAPSIILCINLYMPFMFVLAIVAVL